MGPLLEGLKKLQAVENQLRAAKTKLNRCRRSVILQENQIRSLQNALEAKKEEIQLTKVQADRLELEMKTRDEMVSKLRASLNAAKTNKEYSAVLTQLNTTRADNSKIETQVLELMKDIDEDQAECEKLRNQIDEQKRVLEQIRKDAEGMALKYEAEIQEIQAHWDQVAAALSPESLDTFNRVAETYDGEATALVEKAEARNDTYNCGGCFMGITIESVNVLMTKDEIIRCPNCTRILLIDNQ